MSVAVPIRRRAAKATAETSRRLGRVARCAPAEAGTEVTVTGVSGTLHHLHVQGHADEQAARRVQASFHRISWARLHLHDDGPRGSVDGVRHRLPVSVPVPVDAVLALAAGGVPTLVVCD